MIWNLSFSVNCFGAQQYSNFLWIISWTNNWRSSTSTNISCSFYPLESKFQGYFLLLMNMDTFYKAHPVDVYNVLGTCYSSLHIHQMQQHVHSEFLLDFALIMQLVKEKENFELKLVIDLEKDKLCLVISAQSMFHEYHPSNQTKLRDQ